MVLLGVGEDDGGDGFGVELEAAVDLAGLGAGALEEAAVEEDGFLSAGIEADFVEGAGDGLAAPWKWICMGTPREGKKSKRVKEVKGG